MSLQQHIFPQKRRFGRFTHGQNKPMMAMVEVTNRCDMSCPICYADADHVSEDVSIGKIRLYLERLLKLTQTPIPIQLSGGEPSLRDDLPEIVALAYQIGYRNIELITNGIRISKEPNFLNKLKEMGLSAVYLQFDGLKKEITLKIRGRDMSRIRIQAVSAIRNAGLCCTLAVVVTRGVNEEEIGDVLRFGIENIDVVRAINFQSAARFSGRFGLNENYKGYEMQELLELIEAQTGIAAETFRSDHIGHPCCNAMSPVFVVNGNLEPLFKYLSKDDVLTFLGEDPRNKILATFAGKKDFFFRHLLNPKAWRLIKKAAPIFDSNPYNVLRTDHLLLFAKSFMENDTLDPQRINQCCYAISAQEGVFSFCAYNNLYRFSHQTIA